jgi:hypothetical protein
MIPPRARVRALGARERLAGWRGGGARPARRLSRPLPASPGPIYRGIGRSRMNVTEVAGELSG